MPTLPPSKTVKPLLALSYKCSPASPVADIVEPFKFILSTVKAVKVPREIIFGCVACVVAVSGASPVIVDTVPAFPVIDPSMAFVTVKSVNQPLVILVPVIPISPVRSRLEPS